MNIKALNVSLGYHEFFRSIFDYREYLKQSVARDLRKKYKRSALGYLWSMLNPLFMMIVLTIVFSNIMTRVETYSVFLFAALLPWQYFSSVINGSLTSIRGNMKIIEQVPIPKFIFMVSEAASGLVNYLLSLVPLVVVMLVVGHPLYWTILLFPLVLLPLIITTLGISLLLSVSNVFFEDTQHLTKVILSALYYLTPILYGPEHLPEHLVRWLQWNPMFSIVHFSRELFYFGTLPDLMAYSTSLLSGLVILAVALWVFKRSDDKFIYFA